MNECAKITKGWLKTQIRVAEAAADMEVSGSPEACLHAGRAEGFKKVLARLEGGRRPALALPSDARRKPKALRRSTGDVKAPKARRAR